MSSILYVQTDPQDKKGVPSPLLSDRDYDALFCDKIGERTHLTSCLNSLKTGDTLYVSREAHLADELSDAVCILGNLANRGVNVWVERIKRLFSADDSPFGSRIGTDAADALTNFHKAFVAHRLKIGREQSEKQAQKVFPVRSE